MKTLMHVTAELALYLAGTFVVAALLTVANPAIAQMPGGGYPGGGYPGGGYPGGGAQPGHPGGGAQPEQPGAGGSVLDQLMAWERADAGVRPPQGLHNGPFHGPTPSQLPGGQVITTKGLVSAMQQGVQFTLFHVLGGAPVLPNAIPAEWAAQPGSFNDPVQQQLGQMLQQATRGNPEQPLVFYCQGPQCWMSYNAAVRAINLGYKNVLWYRGGVEAWQHAGLPMAQGQFRPGMGGNGPAGPGARMGPGMPGGPQMPGQPGPGGYGPGPNARMTNTNGPQSIR